MAIRITCNKCLKEVEHGGYYHLSNMMKYGSKNDGRYMQVDICVDCMDDFLDTMQIYPFDDSNNAVEEF